MPQDVQWAGDKFLEQTKQQLGNNLEKAAIFYKEQVKLALNRSQDRERSVGDAGVHYKGLAPSAPGEAPKKLTGFLQRSIAHAMSPDRTQAYVGTGLAYGLYLEVGTSKMQARPYFRPTLLANQDAINTIIATGKK